MQPAGRGGIRSRWLPRTHRATLPLILHGAARYAPNHGQACASERDIAGARPSTGAFLSLRQACLAQAVEQMLEIDGILEGLDNSNLFECKAWARPQDPGQF